MNTFMRLILVGIFLSSLTACFDSEKDKQQQDEESKKHLEGNFYSSPSKTWNP